MAEYYKTATLTGAAPAGHPVAVQVWNYEPEITDFGTPSVLATDVGAMQGVAASSSYFFTSSGTSAAPANNRHIRTYNTSWALQHTKDTALDFASHSQVNGLFYDAGASKLYASANNFNTTPSAGWILEYDVAGDGSLTFVSAHSVGSIWSEAAFKHDGSWWIVGHDKHEIHQYDLTWTLVQIHTLPGTDPFQAPNGELYQGIVFVGDVAIVNRHSGHLDSPRADSYRWTGSGFIAEFLDLSPPQYCTQGIHLSVDGASILWARRNLNDSTTPADVVSTPIVNSYEGVGLEGRNLADFSDVRFTDADGVEVAAWLEHYIHGRTAFFHIPLPVENVTTRDYQTRYGSGAAATRAAASSVTLKINDFESGRDDFVNNYNTGSAASSAGAGLLGTAGLAVSSPGTGDGVYSDDNDFMTAGLRKLTGWVKHVSGQAGTTPTSVWFMQTVSGTTRRRGAIRFNSTNAEALSNGVVQTPFATGFTADTWRRFQVEFDYANTDFGLKVWDDQGILRGSTARNAYSTDDGTRTYKDVLLFRAMTADRIFSQALLATEPTWGAWSAETAGATEHSGAAVHSGEGALVAVARLVRMGSAALTGSGNVTVTAQRQANASASLFGTGTVAATARRNLLGSTALTGTGSLTASGSTGGALTAAATLAGTGTFTATATRTRGASVSLAGTGSISAATSANLSVGAVLVGEGALSALSRLEAHVSAALAGTSTLAAVGRSEAPRVATVSPVYRAGPVRPRQISGSTRPRAVSMGRR